MASKQWLISIEKSPDRDGFVELSDALLKAANLKCGDKVLIKVTKTGIVIKKVESKDTSSK